jgi:AraC-like DNA-binding protein
MTVVTAVKKLGLHAIVVELGMVEIRECITEKQREKLKGYLLGSGLELITDRKNILVEKIKNVIIKIVHYSDDLPGTNYSSLISEQLKYDYTYLSNIFSEVKGVSIKQFIIVHKIERAKELLVYDELNLTAIAVKLHYSSVAHLSNQFKRVTGYTPSFFKALKQKKRTALENM